MRLIPISAALVLVLLAAPAQAQPSGVPPLTERDVLQRLRVKAYNEPELISLVEKRGVDFAVTEKVRDQLVRAGAHIGVIRAIRRAFVGPVREEDVLDYPGVLRLLAQGVPEEAIIQRLEKSPWHPTLGRDQVRELIEAGATENLLRALQKRHVSLDSGVQDYALILDCSLSMRDRTPDGRRKIDKAKEAVIDVIRRLPPGKRLTLLVYGHNGGGCEAVEVFCSRQAVDPRFKKAIVERIAAIQAVGKTPIALALRMVGAELADADGLCEVLVITDGMETCDGDPCAEARRLTRSLHLIGGVIVIAFGTDPDEEKEVARIAEAGDSKFMSAPTPAALDRWLRQLEKDRAETLLRLQREAEERRAANKARRDAALQAAKADAAKAAAAAAQARASAGMAEGSAKAAMTAANNAKVGLGDAERAQAALKKAEDAARRAANAADKARGAAIAAEGVDKAEDAIALAEDAASHRGEAEAAAGQAQAAAAEAAGAQAAVAQAIKDAAGARDLRKVAEADARRASRAAAAARDAASQTAKLAEQAHNRQKRGGIPGWKVDAIDDDARKADGAAKEASAQADRAREAARAVENAGNAEEAGNHAGKAGNHARKAEEAVHQAENALNKAAVTLDPVRRK